MGSSVRKTSQKIKKLLNEAIENNPNTNVADIIPNVAEQTLRSKRAKGYFGDKDFIALAGGGLACFKKVSAIGYENFLHEYSLEPGRLSVIDATKIVESILNSIEEDTGEIESPLIFSAFQTTMTQMLLNGMTNPEDFLTLFCEKFITLIIREEAGEELLDTFKNTTNENFNKPIEDFAKKYVREKFSSHIKKCDSQEQITDLIKQLQAELK